ncbi:MAG: hypothetical protein KFF68_07465 [Desulfosarcina sp.]|nr:hypothetical protein [Desulfosarcina sp.]
MGRYFLNHPGGAGHAREKKQAGTQTGHSKNKNHSLPDKEISVFKAKGGLVLVQSEDSAGYDGMPRSAAGSGVADIIVGPEVMPQRLIQYFSHPDRALNQQPAAAGDQRDWLNKIFAILRTRTGHDFSLYKKNTLLRRIDRRMELNQIAHPGQYVRYLRENPIEVDVLFRELLIGVTSFYRDPESFDVLKSGVLPELLGRLKEDATFPGLDPRLFHGRRGLFAGHCDPRGTGYKPQAHQRAAVRHGH